MRTVLLVLPLLLLGCERDTASALSDRAEETALPTTVSALDSLAGRNGMVSVNGRVADHARGERTLILDDGTGLVRVTLPEESPVLAGHRLFVRGPVRLDDGAPVLDAVEWLYDSTAISIRSD